MTDLPGLTAAEHCANVETRQVSVMVRVQVGQEHLRRQLQTTQLNIQLNIQAKHSLLHNVRKTEDLAWKRTLVR